MALLASQPLSAAIGLALVLFVIWVFVDHEWLSGILLLIALAYVTVPFVRDSDYVARILLEQVVVILFLMGRSLVFAWTGYVASGVSRFLFSLLVIVAAWIWIQRGAGSKLWVAVALLGVVVLWRIAVNAGRSEAEVQANFQYQTAAEVTPQALLKRDEALLGAVYKVAHGRAGKFVAARDIAAFLELSGQEAEVAVHRLIDSGKIEENEYGSALSRRGIEAFERRHAAGKWRSPVSNIFNFHGNASGVFGSDNKIYGNKFTSGVLSDGLLEKLLAAAVQARAEAAGPQARQIDAAVAEVQAAGDDPDRLRRGVQRLARIAGTLGEIGAPLLRVATEVITVLPS
ncbi:hypothetical protein AB0B83_25180 [Micromonospora sp. NPDC049060]|uniref:hypothetical protein n=1 Tax=Micromonospora sp. NPDC049060 TaxID=3154828 RepID=UPI0033E7252F